MNTFEKICETNNYINIMLEFDKNIIREVKLVTADGKKATLFIDYLNCCEDAYIDYEIER